ncbi:MAG: hypothetical protein AAGA09_03840 [Pseudomonadota bacterium]
MEGYYAVEKRRPVRETAAEKLSRETAEFFAGLIRMAVLSLILTPVLLAAFLTVDIPMRLFDGFVGTDLAVRPSNWLSRGGMLIALTPLIAILFARRVGGDEASRAITASWGVAAIAVMAELTYLAPALEAGDFPTVRFSMVFVASAMAAQYVAVGVYDVARGGQNWWRAALYGALGGYIAYGLIYFPGIYFGVGAPWLNWMIGDMAIKAVLAFLFVPVYGMLRRPLKPTRGFGGI